MELNSEGKIKLEETINESIINGDANTTANVSDSTVDDSINLTQNTDKTDASDKNDQSEPTAAVLSIEDPEQGEIYKNHLICNNINNNHIPNKTENEMQASDSDAKNNIDNANDKRVDANGDVVNNDSNNKRLFNNSNTDAANAVGFLFPLHTHTQQTNKHKFKSLIKSSSAKSAACNLHFIIRDFKLITTNTYFTFVFISISM